MRTGIAEFHERQPRITTSQSLRPTRLGSHTLLLSIRFPVDGLARGVFFPAESQILFLTSMFLHHQTSQPFVFRLELSDSLFEQGCLVLQFLGRVLESLFALLLLDAKASRGSGVAATFVFFGGVTRGGCLDGLDLSMARRGRETGHGGWGGEGVFVTRVGCCAEGDGGDGGVEERVGNGCMAGVGDLRRERGGLCWWEEVEVWEGGESA